MPKNQTLDEFYSTFREEVLCASDTETSGWTTEDFLTNVMMEYLEEAGEVTDPVICPFRGYGLQMNAYAISEDCESVDIFVSIYSESDRPRSVSQADIDAAISVLFSFTTRPSTICIQPSRRIMTPMNSQ